jgi:tungstate transport system ATP-binding protein
MNDIILEAKNIRKKYDKEHVLNIDNVKIYKSAFNFLIGPNGSGKTTLLNILSLVDTDFQGEVLYKGQSVKKENFDILNLRRNFSVIWQNPYLFKGTVATNIALPLKLRNVKEKEIEMRVKDMAKQLDIKHLLEKKSNELSGGEMQKTSIARSLITNPEILFVDEPNISLDYESTRYFNNLFLELIEEGITILLITHDLYQIENFAEYITVLNDGKVAKSGPDVKLDF